MIRHLNLIWGEAVALLVGEAVAFFAASLLARLWPPLGIVAFVVLSAIWIAVCIEGARRQRNATDDALVADFRNWSKESLPQQFRFIDHSSTFGGIQKEIGSCDLIRQGTHTLAVQYNLPYGSALLIFLQQPLTESSRVRAIRFYKDRNEIPLFP